MSFKEIVNATLRRGLEYEEILPPRKPIVTRPHAFGFKAGIDLDKLNQFVDELEVEASARGLKS